MLQGVLDALRREPRLRVLKTPDELSSFYNELKVQASRRQCRAVCCNRRRLISPIRRVEAFREAGAPALSYQRATPNGNTPAVLYVNPARLAAQPATAVRSPAFLREAVPGHH